MTLRNVLLLTYYFPPSAAVAVYRMLGLVRYLPRHGWQPVVVCPPNPAWEPEDPALLARVPPGTPVVRVPFAAGLWGKVVRRLSPQGHWLPRAFRACEAVLRERPIDAVITTSPPGLVHQLGLRLKAKYRLPWVADFRDPWVTNHRRPVQGLFERYEHYVEGKIMRTADVLVANTPLNQHGWQAAYPGAADRIVTITNGFDPETFDRSVTPPPGRDRLSMLYAGELYSGRDPRPLLDALQQLQTAGGPPLHLTFLGRSTENLYDLPGEIERRGLTSAVALEGQVPYAEASRRMALSDILLLIHTPGYKVGVSAKLYEYLGTGRPILALAEPGGDMDWVLRESGVLHRLVAPADVAGIRQALVELAGEIRAGAPAVGDEAALARFTREHMAQRFAACLDACTGRGALPRLAPAVAP